MTTDGLRPTDVAIVGMAALFPGAPDLDTFWHNIVSGVDAVTEVPAARWDASYYDPHAWSQAATSDKFYCRRGGFIDDIATFEATAFGIMPVAVDSTEPDQLLALKVAAAAIADGGGEATLGGRGRVGVILGRGGYLSAGGARLDQRVRAARQLVASLRELIPGLSEQQLTQVAADFQARLGPERPEASIGLVPNLAASRIANRLDFQGPAYTVDAACASSLLAVDHAVAELTRGRCDTVIAGGVHVCDDVTLWSVFTQLRALSPSQQIRPFDRRADGLLIGEGTGMVVLKRLADAERRGDRIYAVIRGTGVASDGRDASLMRPRVEGQVLALQRAWAAAGLDPRDPGALSLIEAHGTATPVGDEAELTTLRQVFGTQGPALGLGSVKSMIGHTMPAAGIAGLIKAALAVHHRMLPPTLHCEDPHPALAGTRFQPQTEAAPWGDRGDGLPRRAAVNAFGFGGINAHVIVEESPNARAAAAPLPTGRRSRGVTQRVLLLAGATADELIRQLAADDGELLARDDIKAVPAGGPWRVAIVDPNPTRLELARKVVARGRPWRGRNDVWFTSAPLLAHPDAKMAFLFPGVEQTFDPQVDGVAEHFGLPDPGLGGTQNLGRHSLATLAVGRLLDAALHRLGLQPDVVAGHSIGEWNAMIAAGMHDGAALDRVMASFDTDSIEVPGVVFAALGCGAEMADAAITGLDRVVISHDNCPHQSIICGEEASVAVALERLRAEGVMGQVLAFRSGFHTPMVEPYLAAVGEQLQGLELRPATTPIWSATTVAPYPDDLDAVHDLAVRHLLEPVRFGPMVQRLHDTGVRAFIQVGSGSLTGFLDDALRDREQLVISACTSKNNGLDQLLRVAAALWVEGRAPNLARLAPPTARPRGTSVTLRLGTPVVHFDSHTRPVGTPVRTTASPSALEMSMSDGPPSLIDISARQAAHPVLAEFGALLADAQEAASAVVHSWTAPPPPPAPPTEATVQRTVSVATMPYLADHCFYRQADGWPDISDRFPVVPMTTMLELMMDGARALVPGRTIIGLAKVRALRWLAPTEAVTLTVKASRDEEGNVDVILEGYARGKVLVADNFPPAPSGRPEPLHNERPSTVRAEQLYQDRWLFHGPQFQGVTEIQGYADDGIRGRLVSLAAPGGLLDNAGQLMGFWIRTTVASDKLAFPASIERLELFGPHPAPGQELACTVWVRSVTDTSVTADLEVCRPDGTVWARITGWNDRRFFTDAAVDPILRWPEKNRIAEEQPGGWFLLRDRWPDPANRELVMRRYLAAAERRHYDQQNPRGRHRWLLGRMAAKDAVRQWLWDHGAGPLYPAQFQVANEESGRPVVAGLPAGAGISIAHSGELAVAVVGQTDAAGRGVGIDVQVIEDRTPQFEAMACTDAERALLDQLNPGHPGHGPNAGHGPDAGHGPNPGHDPNAGHGPDAGHGPNPGHGPNAGVDQLATGFGRLEGLTRFWAAKEAVAKAVGTGLGGRPHRFEIQETAGTQMLVAALDCGSRWWVDTTIVRVGSGPSRYAVAWTTTGAIPPSAVAVTTGGFSPLSLVTERITNGR